MARVLRRPMFRLGGNTDQGIMSGVAPRQGYAEPAGMVEKLQTQKSIIDALAPRPPRRDSSMRDFMIDFGLDIASREPSGSIFSTAAAAAKDPFDRYTSAKQEADAAQYATESDMFKTMLGAQADILAAERGEGMAGKTEQWKMEQIPIYINTISEIENLKNSDEWNTLTKEEQTEKQNELDTARTSLGRLEKEDVFVGWFLQSDQSDKLFKKVKTELLEADQQSDEPVYSGEDDPQLWEDTYVEFKIRVKRMGKAEGGRIGYQNAGAVMPGAMPMNQAAGPTDQGPAPEDMAGITYEELRARLPQEVTDDIVRLLANSAEALEDFAMIQTEQDINIFNKKYGVNLVLPSEG